MKLFKRIPLIVWAIILTAFAFYIVKSDTLGFLSANQITLLTGLFTLIGLIFVSVQVQAQWKDERIKTEYLNQPDFELTGFGTGQAFIGSTPILCENNQDCTDDHWLNFTQTGNLAAKNLKVALFHKDEAEVSVSNKDRWLDEERLGKGDTFQYKLPPFNIPFQHFKRNSPNCFLLLLEYESEYSKIKYKRIYKLCANANIPFLMSLKTVKIEGDWKNKILFYKKSVENAVDTDSIQLPEILKTWRFKILRLLRIKKNYTYENWLLDI
jgi:hypothetical protein